MNQHVIYYGPEKKRWKPYQCYVIQVRPVAATTLHIGTVASHNDRQGVEDPTPIRLRSLRKYFDWFVPVDCVDHYPASRS